MAIDFEKIHKEFDGLMVNLCAECDGACEKNKITVFLPGELEFVAGKLNINVKEFIAKNCNTVKYKGNTIHMLKAGICPFLNCEYRCELEKANCKLIDCLFFPIIINFSEKKPTVCVDFLGCPMANKIPEDYKNKIHAIYEEIKHEIPIWWLEFVTKYDEALYDYEKLEKLRANKLIKLTELKQCII